MYESVNQASTGSDNGFSPIRRQAIIWTSAGLLSIWLLGSLNQNTKFIIHENASENIVYKKAAILSRARWVKEIV